MIKATPLLGGAIPHEDNIKAIHSSIPLLGQLDRLGAIYAGGYPMALMLAPRTKHGDAIRDGFYHDHDTYFKDEFSATIAIALLDSQPEKFHKVSNTANACSYNYIKQNQGEPSLSIQIIKKVYGTAEDIIKRFDFVNCAMAYEPSRNMMYWHKDALVKHLASELEILDPWMLDQPKNKEHMLIQLARFRKYTIRWDYTLSDAAFNRLLAIYLIMPNLRLARDVAVMVESDNHEYAERVFIGHKNDNVWEAISDVFRSHRLWSNTLDLHGHISNGRHTLGPLLTEVPDTQININGESFSNVFNDEAEIFF
jgi:hypothetical protein